MYRFCIVFMSLVLFGWSASAQMGSVPFELSLEEVMVDNFDGVHSGVVAVGSDGRWLLIGGRRNGLHGYLPPFAFPLNSRNTDFMVLDVPNNQMWSLPSSTLADSLRDQLSSSNAQYVQVGGRLYIAGGYGYENNAGDYITFPRLASVSVDALISKVVSGSTVNLKDHFKQIYDERLAVTGGNLVRMYGRYFLVFGHRFDGRYNHLHNGGSFVQSYSHQIRSFKITETGTALSVSDYQMVEDTTNFHRRDYNLVLQVNEAGTGLMATAYSGVFRRGADLPFYNAIHIQPDGSYEVGSFEQQFSHYHSAHVPMYDSLSKDMFTVFFGGMAQFYPDSLNPNVIVEDTLVPFVKTISVVRRYNGIYTETVLPIRMPAFLGSNAEFIPAHDSLYENDILRLGDIDTGADDSLLIGYLVGGIESPRENIFRGSESESRASNRIFKVYIKHQAMHTGIQNAMNDFEFSLTPNPSQQHAQLSFNINGLMPAKVLLRDATGRLLATPYQQPFASGEVSVQLPIQNLPQGTYYCQVSVGNVVKTIPLVKQ
jgi:hypothetical protein